MEKLINQKYLLGGTFLFTWVVMNLLIRIMDHASHSLDSISIISEKLKDKVFLGLQGLYPDQGNTCILLRT